MKPWIELGTAHIPNNGGMLKLRQRDQEFSITLCGPRGELMNSRRFNSERELSLLGCAHLKKHKGARVVVGGMGMGYTLAAALEVLPSCAEVVVAELIRGGGMEPWAPGGLRRPATGRQPLRGPYWRRW